jgi:cysteine desulfurase
VFTSGGTEGDNLAIKGLALANPRGRHLISARTEHEAVLEALDYLERQHGFEITWLPIASDGSIAVSDLSSALRADTTLVTLMLGNNEVGTIHPIASFAAAAHEVGALFHTDAVQCVGWVDCRVSTLGVDALTLSGHKFGAPKGSGVTFIRAKFGVEPLIHGGGQEAERRSGTENVAWAVALASALELQPWPNKGASEIAEIRDTFVSAVLKAMPCAIATGSMKSHLPNIASFCFEGLSGEAILLELERRSVIVSSGSACAAGSDEPSHVLTAMGFAAELAQTAVRFSLSHQTTDAELDSALEALVESVAAVGGTSKIAE